MREKYSLSINCFLKAIVGSILQNLSKVKDRSCDFISSRLEGENQKIKSRYKLLITAQAVITQYCPTVHSLQRTTTTTTTTTMKNKQIKIVCAS
jgi:hypothetical protein